VPPTTDDLLTARFAAWDGSTVEDVVVRADGDGLTAEGRVVRAPDGAHHVHWVLRLDEAWRVRQLLLFRDLDEPDLWLGHDGSGGWGEINGAHRPELDGCTVVDLACTPLTTTLAVRHLAFAGLEVGASGDLEVVAVDPATLGVVATVQRWTRVAERRWRLGDGVGAGGRELVIDDDGVAVDDIGRFRRLA
jgi:hypothetical protein